MDKIHYLLLGVLLTGTIFLFPFLQASYSHQSALFEINGREYLFIVGSANEPLYVDDKTKATLGAYLPYPSNSTNKGTNNPQPLTGLEDILKLEIMAGDKKMTSNLEPAYGEVGKYESETFYPTIPTTFSYRIFGDINGTSFDATFSCSPAGELGPADYSTVNVSENVVRKAMQGGFGCPQERVGFPEPYISQFELIQQFNGTISIK